MARNTLAWFLATCPNLAHRDPARAVALARKAVQDLPESGAVWNTLGVAHYRAGDWDACIAALDRATSLNREEEGSDWLFLAMAHWQRGDRKRARVSYEKATKCLAQAPSLDEEMRRFQAEAALLLGKEKSK
jgi:Flp pilus assembly protein TadD